jgi:DNA-binding MarR family transcriptional regulator
MQRRAERKRCSKRIISHPSPFVKPKRHRFGNGSGLPDRRRVRKDHAMMTHVRRQGREKVFGAGRPRPMDREAKVRLMTLARALKRRTTARKHYGPLTAKAVDVLEALLWTFHNARSGLCFPSIRRIAEAAGCCPATVVTALKALEAAGLLSWVNRLVRRRTHEPAGWRWRVFRTSNGYRFVDPREPSIFSKVKNRSGTQHQDSSISSKSPVTPLFPELAASFSRLEASMNNRSPG